MQKTKWSDDAFLDHLRTEGDETADRCLHQLAESESNYRGLFRLLRINSDPLPEDAPAPIHEFFETACRPPLISGEPIDEKRLERGSEVFRKNAGSAGLSLMLNSLLAGYGAPNLAKILVISGNLQHHPYQRVLGVLQMVIDVSANASFEPSGDAHITAAKVRLMHAGLRTIVDRRRPDYEPVYGKPVNQEDMLGTIMGFSLLVIQGIRKLGITVTDEDAEDYYYLWRVFAQCAGIHPPGERDSSEHIPESVELADEFYRSFARRHYVGAAENPEGVDLTKAGIRMFEDIIPFKFLHWWTHDLIGRVFMQRMQGRKAMKARGVKPVYGKFLVRWLLLIAPRIWNLISREGDKLLLGNGRHEDMSLLLFKGMIHLAWGGKVTFLIPRNLQDLKLLAPVEAPKRKERRIQDRRRTTDAIDFPERRGPDRRLAYRESFWAGA